MDELCLFSVNSFVNELQYCLCFVDYMLWPNFMSSALETASMIENYLKVLFAFLDDLNHQTKRFCGSILN